MKYLLLAILFISALALAACARPGEPHRAVPTGDEVELRQGGPPVVMVSTSETLSLPEAACRAAPFDTFKSPQVCEFHFEYPSAWTKEKGCHLAVYFDAGDSQHSYLLGDLLWPMHNGFCRLADAGGKRP